MPPKTPVVRREESYRKQVIEDEQRLRQYWQPRTDQITLERKLRDLDDIESIVRDNALLERALRVIDNHPQAYWDWAVASIANNPIKWTVPAQVRPKDGGKALGDLERMAYGFDWQLDAFCRERGEESWRYLLAEQIMTGWFAFFPDLVEEDDGSVYATIAFWDPLTVFQEPGYRGMKTVIRSYSAPLWDLREYCEQHGGSVSNLSGDPSQNVPCITAWYWKLDGKRYRVFNTLLVDSKLALPYAPQDDYDVNPVVTGSIGGRGIESWTQGQDRRQALNRGRGILAPLVRTYQQANHMATLQRARARKDVFPDIADYTEDGEGVIEPGDIGQQGKSGIIHLKTTEKVGAVELPPTGIDMRLELERERGQIEQGSIPPQLFGSNNPQLASGYLEARLEHLAQMRLGRQEGGFKGASQQLMLRLLRLLQHRRLKVTLEGRDLSKRGKAGYYIQEFSYQDVPKTFILRPEHDLLTPVDRASIANTNATLRQLDARTLRRVMEETGIEDPYQEFLEVIQEKAAISGMGSASIMALQFERLAEVYRKAGDTRVAEAFRIQAQVTREQALGEAQMVMGGQQAPQPNLDAEGAPPSTLPTPMRRPDQRPPPPTTGPSQSRNGNRNAAR